MTGESSPAAPGSIFASEHTNNLPELLRQAGISLLVTTYQAGKLIVVRDNGPRLNVHTRTYPKPMGLAADNQRFALGTTQEILHYSNMASACSKLPGPERYDACYIQRWAHTTGDIDVHEMAFAADGQLWFVNTRFSCLCTLDGVSSFAPRWRPSFVSALSPEDRCHLNGLGMLNGAPRYVTALGRGDSFEGWRPTKANGGLLIDIQTNRILCDDLSMPHSPRWHAGQLWVLESGRGGLCRVDYATGRRHTVAQVPGFTRGLDFHGPLAFVGLSQVRDAKAFSNLPLTEGQAERICGVWVVNINNGETLGFLRFTAGVEEIFAVSVLQGLRYPAIVAADDPLTAASYAVPPELLKDVVPPKIPEDVLAKGR